MLKSKKLQAILSLLIAIGLWMYVMGSVDPTVTATVRNIPVEKANEKVLKDMGMTATLDSPETVDIVIKGARSDVNEAKKSDITATVDVSNCEYGKNEAKIDIEFPDKISGVKVDSMSEEKATFTVQ
jgi:YbbR domain-containing protein